MKAVLLSDLTVIKTQAKSVLLVLVVWLAITVYNKSGLFFSALSVVYAMMLPLTCIATYEKSHFDRYLFTAPISRASAAMGHYVFSMLCSLCLTAIGFIASVALGMSVGGLAFPLAARALGWQLARHWVATAAAAAGFACLLALRPTQNGGKSPAGKSLRKN